MNNRFEVTWRRDGAVHTKIIAGLSDLAEFARNSDAYGRELISVEALIG